MLNVLSLFSGIGAFEKALENLSIPYNLLAYCEIDKFASKAYSIIHDEPEYKNLKDVTKIDILDIEERVDLITYGFPCQDISNAGKQKGFTDENGERTRSGLFFEALRIIKDYRPKFAIAENVKALTSKKFSEEFKIVLESLEKAGYVNYWQVLNAKNYGIPQNRERVFIISIRKDIDNGFSFPGPVTLELRLKDLLEDTVDDKFYLSEDRISNLIEHKRHNQEKGNGFGTRFMKDTDITSSLTTSPDKSAGQYVQVLSIGNINPSGKGQNGLVIDSEGLARAITIEKGEGQKVLVREATKKGYNEAYPGDSINLEQPNSKTRRDRVGKEVAQTLTTSCNQAVVIDKKIDIDSFLNS